MREIFSDSRVKEQNISKWRTSRLEDHDLFELDLLAFEDFDDC